MIANAVGVIGKVDAGVYTGADHASDDANNALISYADHESISAWAKTALAQSVAAGIMSGYPDHTIAPQDHATRAQAAVMLNRFLQYVGFIDEDQR